MEVRKLSNYSFGGETKLSFDEAVKKVTGKPNTHCVFVKTPVCRQL